MGCLSPTPERHQLHESSSHKMVPHVVVVDVCQARNVKKMDLLSQSDTYLKVKVGKQENRTKVFSNSKRPVWNQSFKFGGFMDKPTEVVITAMDRDVVTPDDFIGRVNLNLAACWGKTGEWQWIPLLGKNKEENVGEIQVRVTAGLDESPLKDNLEHHNYTHLIQLEIIEAKSLKRKDLIGKNDCYAMVSWENKTFKTQTVSGDHPRWNQKVFFWATSPEQSSYYLKFTVMDQDLKTDDELGTAFFHAAPLFKTEGIVHDEWVPLIHSSEIKDKDLSELKGWPEEKQKGQIRIRARIADKGEIERDFFQKLLTEFDSDDDGKLSREEVTGMITALGIEMSDVEFEHFWDAVDADKSDEVTKDEAIFMLKSLLFLSPASANQVLHFLASGIEGISSSLVEPVPATHTGSSIAIIDRPTGIVVKENIPTYVQVAIKSVFTSRAGAAFITSKRAIKMLHKMSVKQGIKYDNPASVSEIPGFVRLHNLNMDEALKPIPDYKTFNEFFARELRPTARPIASPEDNNIAVCPADCRLSAFQDVNDATKLWIKGDEFTIDRLLGPLGDELGPRFAAGSLCIARLAPQDYHRWHIPCTGHIKRCTLIDGALFTVNPFAVNNHVNVYTMNKRVVCELETKEFGLVILIAVGATMVGSINFVAKEKSDVKKGQVHGYFSFGGSTVILLFEKNRIQFDQDLAENSKKKLETLVRVNSSLGRAVQH